MTVPTNQFPAPRQFWIYRIPSFIRGKDPVKYKPSRADATPMICIGQSAASAREAMARFNGSGSETHFIRVHRTPITNQNNSMPRHRSAGSSEASESTLFEAPLGLSGQITLSWDGAVLRAEAPGRNGARQKIEDATFADLPLWLKTQLISQLEDARDRQRNHLMSIQRENVQYVSESQNIAFAKKIWGSDWIASRTIRARLAKPGQYDPISGKIRGAEKPEKEILDLDL